MFSIGLLVHAQHVTGSFAAAGVVTGVYAIALGVGGPRLGQLVDRHGQTAVLLASASVAAGLLVAIAVLPAGTPVVVLLALAAGIGLAEPPVGACLRTQLPALVPDPGAVRAAYALEASALELAVWGAGSFIGGLLVTRLGGGARTAAGLAFVLGTLTAGHLALIPAHRSIVALGVVLLVAGAAIAPTEATVYAMVDHAAPSGTMTEAFAWLATAMAVGGAAGAAGAGILVDRAGPAAAFALAGGAGALAVLTTILRSRTLVTGRDPRTPTPGRRPASRGPRQEGLPRPPIVGVGD